MIMTPSKTAARQEDPRIPTSPEWIAVMQKAGPEAANTREISTRSKAWWDLVADMIVGRR